MNAGCVRRTRVAVAFVAVSLVTIALAATSMPAVAAEDLKLLCAGALKPAMLGLLARRGNIEPHVDVVYATAGGIRERLAAGERYDVAIMPNVDMERLVLAHRVSPPWHRALGETGVGVAVRSDAPSPDIATADGLRAALLAARKVVIVDPAKGTSGGILMGVFSTLGITSEMEGKTIKVDGGYVLELVAKGEADLGMQQIPEILAVPGVKLVGPLPQPLQKSTRYDVGALVDAPHEREAQALVTYFTSDESLKVVEASGFRRVR